MTTAVLKAVYCHFGLCPYLMAKGKPCLVGEIETRARLRCPSCRQVQFFEV